jgi:hypothetical protein
MLFFHKFQGQKSSTIGSMATLLFSGALGVLQAGIQNHVANTRRSLSIQHKGIYRLMPAAVKLVKPHRHFGVTVPVCVKGRKRLGRWRPTQYRVFRPTKVSNNKMTDAVQMVDNKRTIPSQQKEDPRLAKRRFHTLPHFSPIVVFPSKFISYIH